MLKRLYLNYNHITRIEKNSFTGLKKLTELYLENNGLKDIAPGALDELNINVLHLKDNKLEEMPVFRKPSEIAYLDLSSNPITKLDAKALGKHHDLQELHLRHTEITTLENRVFVNNTQLRTLVHDYIKHGFDVKYLRDPDGGVNLLRKKAQLGVLENQEPEVKDSFPKEGFQPDIKALPKISFGTVWRFMIGCDSLFCERVHFSIDRWKSILPKLESFFNDWIVPELVYPRVKYGIPKLNARSV